MKKVNLSSPLLLANALPREARGAKTTRTRSTSSGLLAGKKNSADLPRAVLHAAAVAGGAMFDPAQHVPAIAAPVKSTRRNKTVAEKLRSFAKAAGAKESTILSRAARALERLAKSGYIESPLSIRLSDDSKAPESVSGCIYRTTNKSNIEVGPGEVLFVPNNRSLSPLVIPALACDGIAEGGEVGLLHTESVSGEKVYKIFAREEEYAASFVADVVLEDGAIKAKGRGDYSPYKSLILSDSAKTYLGQAVIVDVKDATGVNRSGEVRELLGDITSHRAKFIEIALAHGAQVGYSKAVMARVKELQQNPDLSGPDFTHLPFVTIDNPDPFDTNVTKSKDLDQAMCLQRGPDGGYVVHYAIADVAHFIKKDDVIDKEAMRRSFTTYLPSDVLAMLPKELSEDLISLLPDGKRRAVVATIRLDAEGKVMGKDYKFTQALIKSRAKLNYAQVHEHLAKGKDGALHGRDYSETLALLKEIGDKRSALAKKRGVAKHHDTKMQIKATNKEGTEFAFQLPKRYPLAEEANEQISLLLNELVGTDLDAAGITTVNRVDAAPRPNRVKAFRERTEQLGRPWQDDETIADYLARQDINDPLGRALHLMALVTNERATYDTTKIGHDPLKLKFYVHFTAPMRRYPDFIPARQILAKLEGKTGKDIPYNDPKEMAQVLKSIRRADARDDEIATAIKDYFINETLKTWVGKEISANVLNIGGRGASLEAADPALQVTMDPDLVQQLTGKELKAEAKNTELRWNGFKMKIGKPVALTVVAVDATAGTFTVVPTQLLAKKAGASTQKKAA